MFEHFTFGAPAPRISSIREISPTDTTSIPRRRERIAISDLITPGPLEELIAKMSDVEPPSSSPQDSYFDLNTYSLSRNSHSDSDSQSEPSSPTTPPPGHDRRLQRQIHSRMQCSASHLRSVHALVEQMISEGNQCKLSPTPKRAAKDYFSVEHDSSDESGDSETEMSLRRASMPSGIRKERIPYRGRADKVVKVTTGARARRPTLKMRKGEGNVKAPVMRRME